MMPEDRAARVAHRSLSPQSSWEQFERMLLSQQRPCWNQAVGLIADAIREFDWYQAFWALAGRVREALEEHDTAVIEGYLMPRLLNRRRPFDR